MSLAATTSDGLAVQLLSFDGKQCLLVGARAYAPGNPMRLRVERPQGSLALEVKSIGSRKREDGTFEIRARITTIPAEVRDALLAHFGGGG